MFEFILACKTYDYTTNDHKLKFIPSTLKYVALLWLMSVEGNDIPTWEKMHQTFNKKYQDYKRVSGMRDEIYRMIQGKNLSMKGSKETF